MSTLADIIRTLSTHNMTRNELKVARARLRRAKLTNLIPGVKGPYAIDTSSDEANGRAEAGTLIVGAVAMAA